MTTEPATTPSTSSPPPRGRGSDRGHWTRLLVLWVVLSAAAIVIWMKLVGPHVPPGRLTSTADGAAFDFNVLIVLALPVLLGVWIYMLYALIVFRSKKDPNDPVATAASRGNKPMEWSWIVITTVLVLFLAGFGTYELVQPEGSGGGQGPTPVWTPAGFVKGPSNLPAWKQGSSTVLVVQVIGQQWKFTYRYPQFGGFETNDLVLPLNSAIAFHVTSLDVIHSFWAYQLGVKADANPQADNVAFTTPAHTGYFTVRCNELCGLWHGAMFNEGQVVSQASFENWATKTQAQLAQNTAYLPPFAYYYVPDANGADGGYYPDNVDPYSPVETYGATTPAGGG
jgi:cytochrome c oxidase subunit 2